MRLLHVLLLPLSAITLFAQTPAQPAASPASSPQSSSPGYVAPLFNATTRNVILDAVVFVLGVVILGALIGWFAKKIFFED